MQKGRRRGRGWGRRRRRRTTAVLYFDNTPGNKSLRKVPVSIDLSHTRKSPVLAKTLGHADVG